MSALNGKRKSTEPTFDLHLHLGKSWPFEPLDHGTMRVEPHFGPSGVLLVLGVDMGDLSPAEKPDFRRAPMRVGYLARDHYVLFAVAAGPMVFDASLAPGRAGADFHAGFVESLQGAADRRFCVACVDRGIVRGIREFVLPDVQWKDLAAALAACPATFDAAQFDAALADDQQRWRPSEVLVRATPLTTLDIGPAA